QHFRRFDHHVRMQRGGEVIEADTAIALLDADSTRIESVELRGGTHISMTKPPVGAPPSLTGRDVTLKYASGGQAIERATLAGQTMIVVAGSEGHPGRPIASETRESLRAPDGTTRPSVIGRDKVSLMLPAEGAETPLRTIDATTLDAKGQP